MSLHSRKLSCSKVHLVDDDRFEYSIGEPSSGVMDSAESSLLLTRPPILPSVVRYHQTHSPPSPVLIQEILPLDWLCGIRRMWKTNIEIIFIGRRPPLTPVNCTVLPTSSSHHFGRGAQSSIHYSSHGWRCTTSIQTPSFTLKTLSPHSPDTFSSHASLASPCSCTQSHTPHTCTSAVPLIPHLPLDSFPANELAGIHTNPSSSLLPMPLAPDTCLITSCW